MDYLYVIQLKRLNRKLTSDNQLDDDGKAHVVHLEAFSGQTLKMTLQWGAVIDR